MSAAVVNVIPAGTWVIDPSHSTVGFAVRHLGIATVRGLFERYQGSLTVDEQGARVDATVEADSITTRVEDRDAHLRSPDFLNAEEHPTLTLATDRVEVAGDDELVIEGPLTINGVTHPVRLEAEVIGTETDPWGNERVGLELRGKIDRGDYGMRFNQALGSGNVVVGNKVKIAIDVSLVRQAAE